MYFESNNVPGSAESFVAGVQNWWTGDLDYKRSIESIAYQNEFSAKEAQSNRDWQEHMSNTAYQRAVSDMSKAGLNPYLMYSSASPASTPTGAVAQSGSGVHSSSGGKGGFGNVLSALGALVTSAISAGTSSAISAGKLSQSALNNALKSQTAIQVARYNQMRELHHYNHSIGKKS